MDIVVRYETGRLGRGLGSKPLTTEIQRREGDGWRGWRTGSPFTHTSETLDDQKCFHSGVSYATKRLSSKLEHTKLKKKKKNWESLGRRTGLRRISVHIVIVVVMCAFSVRFISGIEASVTEPRVDVFITLVHFLNCTLCFRH